MILVVGVVAHGMLRRTVLVIVAVTCVIGSRIGVGMNEWDPRLV